MAKSQGGSGGGSSSSSTAARAARSRMKGPPIPYRELPYEYQPALLCACGLKTPRWISWSDDNPGMRYHTCCKRQIGGAGDARVGGACRYFQWIDDATTPFVKQLIIDLRDACWERKEEILQLKALNRRLEEELAQERRRKVEKLPEHHVVVHNRDGGLFILWVISVCFAVYVGVVMVG